MDSDIKQLRPHQATVTGNNRKPGAAVSGDASTTASPGNNAPEAKNDTVTVTSEAARLQQLEQAIAGTPVIDSQRVAELRQAIADGSYQPSAERIADKLAQFEQNLI